MLALGQTLQGRYRIVREIGAGGMGAVYEGENLLIRRRVAIKVMRGDAVHHPELCARFELEAQIASQIPSDHITEVLDLGELDGGQRFIVMEYLVGEPLAARLDRVRRLPSRELLVLVRQVLMALAAAHRAGVIHRDVKPENVFILSEKAGRRDFVKLMDFGISKLRPSGSETPLTQSGMFVGTPSYMAPEQVGGGQPSPLWDLYAVGVILYRGITGEMPFTSQQVHELVYKVALGTFTPPSERVVDLDPALDALVCKAMSRSPEQRFQSAEEFIAALDAWFAARGERAVPSSLPLYPLVSTARMVKPLFDPLAAAQPPIPAPPQIPAPIPAAQSPVPVQASITAPLEFSVSPPATPPLAATPLPETAVSAPETPLSTEFGLSPKRGAKSWLGWAAAGGVLLVAAALFAAWRARLDVAAPVTQIEPALQPVSRSTAVAATPPPAAPVAPPAAAPAAAPAPTPVLPPAPPPTSASVVAPPARSATARPKPAASKPRASERASRPKPPTPVAATPAAATPVAPPPTHEPKRSDDSGGKPRPDWGY